MTIIEVAHVIRAAATITKQDEFVIIGSQSILGSYPNIDDETITRSPELDIYPKQYREDLADQISGALGANSPFHENFGYYADGVSPDTATLPLGWEGRLVLVADMESMATRDGRKPKAYFLEPHDLLCAKFAAAREKDYEFCEAAIAKGIAKSDVLMARLESTQMPEISWRWPRVSPRWLSTSASAKRATSEHASILAACTVAYSLILRGNWALRMPRSR